MAWDPIAGVASRSAFAAGLLGAGSDSLIVEGAGHWPHREGEDAFLARLIQFAGEVDQTNGVSSPEDSPSS